MTSPAVEQARQTPASPPPSSGPPASPRPGSPGSTRRTIGAVLATAAMAFVLGGAATAVALRLARLAERPSLNPADPLLVLWIVIVILLIRSAIGRPRPLRPVPAVPTVVQSSFRRLVEASFFGTGSLRGWTITDPDVGLDRIVMPQALDRGAEGQEAPDVIGQERTGRSPGPDARAEAPSAPIPDARSVPERHRPRTTIGQRNGTDGRSPAGRLAPVGRLRRSGGRSPGAANRRAHGCPRGDVLVAGRTKHGRWQALAGDTATECRERSGTEDDLDQQQRVAARLERTASSHEREPER